MATWVLLHGTPLRPAAWATPASHLRDQPVVIPDCTVVAAPGAGPAGAQVALVRGVLAVLPPGELDVVGHSFGGQIALELALAAPERVRTLTVLCSRDTPFPPFAAVADAVRAGHAPPADQTLARWFSPAELAASGPVVADVRHDLDIASTGDWANALDAIATYDRSASAAAAPLSLLAAGLDGVAPPQVMQEWADHTPGATVEVEPGWAHMSAFVDPVGLAARLVRLRDAALRRVVQDLGT